MLELPQKTLNKVKKLLLKQQKEVAEDLKEVSGSDPATASEVAESSEPGTDSWMADVHTRTEAIKNQLNSVASSIGLALSKIKSGTYGKCDNCKKPIEASRLSVVPTAKYCLACSKKLKK